MTLHINRYSPTEAWPLLFPAHLGTLNDIDRDTVHRSVRNSTYVWIGDVDGEVFGFWGLIPPTITSDRAYLWLWNTDSLHKHTFRFIRHSRKVTAELLTHFPILVGHGRSDDIHSLQWLRWCGAEFGEPQGQFIPFEIRASQWPQQLGQSA